MCQNGGYARRENGGHARRKNGGYARRGNFLSTFREKLQVQSSNTNTYLAVNVRLTNRIIEKNAGVCDVLIYNDAAYDIRDDVNR